MRSMRIAQKDMGDLTKQNEEDWRNSIRVKNSIICKCTFEPMYKLIKNNLSESNKNLSTIRSYLEQAHENEIPRGKYKILCALGANSNIFIVSEPRDKRPMEPKKQENDTAPPNSTFTLVVNNMSHTGNIDTKQKCSFHADNFYFGCRNSNPEQMKMSKKSNLFKGNKWVLFRRVSKEEQEYVLYYEYRNFLSLSAKESYMLGVQNEVSPEYVIEKFDETNQNDLASNFKWKLVECTE